MDEKLNQLKEKSRSLIFQYYLLHFFAFVVHPDNRKDGNKKLQYFADPAGVTFEKFCCSFFLAQGYKVHHDGKSGDLGVDIVLNPDDKPIYCQCKNGFALETDFNRTFLTLMGIMLLDDVKSGI